MKSLKWISKFITCLLIIVMGSCTSGDEVTPSDKNLIKMDGESFEIMQASILGVSIGGEGHAAITFISGEQSAAKTLTIDVEYFSEQPIDGRYSFPQVENQRLLNEWLTNYSEFDGNTSNSIHLQEGTVEIIQNTENNYTVKMNLVMDGNKVFSGSYSGDFQVYFNNG